MLGSSDSGQFVVIAMAVFLANLPFLIRKPLLPIRLKTAKGISWESLELLLGYLTTGVCARVLEQSAGQAFAQGWEFYATTLFLYITLAFPGFVHRHLWKSKQ